jgi:hypothetical protein
MKSDTSATPAAESHRVIRTLVSGTYSCFCADPDRSGAMENRPPRRRSSRAAKMVGESKLGNDMKSIELSLPTSATVCISPISP